jgi:hypothetical protein
MKKQVEVLRRRSDGSFILHPKGTFKGHGGILGITPYRELPSDVGNKELGLLVLDLLDLSGPTGSTMADFESYNRKAGEESESVRAKLYPSNATTRSIARNFKRLSVLANPKSWEIIPWRYDSSRNLDSRPLRSVRVKREQGAEELGHAIHRMLSIVDSG